MYLRINFSKVCLFIVVFLNVLLLVGQASSQPLPPEKKYLFIEDKNKNKEEKIEQKEIENQRKSLAEAEKSGKLPFDVSAPSIKFDASGNKLIADGGIILTYSSMILEAVRGEIDTTTKEATISGDVRITDLSGSITADSARINLDTGAGSMENADIFFAEGDFKLKGKHTEREPGDLYRLSDTEMTTCSCAEGNDDCPPWRIRADRAQVVRDGYGQAWGATLDVWNVPVFYTPYLIFPAKTQRQSGLLAGTFGIGRRSGASLELPFFWAINDSSDMTITGVYEDNVRVGADTEYRKVFSLNNRLDMGITYFNESAREGKLLGTNTDGLADPTLERDRVGGYLNQSWKKEIADIPVQLLLDGHYVSDDLFAREYENEKIAKRNSRFVTSRAALRLPVFSAFVFDVSGEFNQSLVSDDDFVFQRLPQSELSGINIFRPFGANDLGLKMVAETNLTHTNFVRRKSYDGNRIELYENLKFPFHYQNYFDAQFNTDVRATEYSLSDRSVIVPASGDTPETREEDLKSSSDRVVPGLGYKMGTVFEKVFDIEDDDNPLKSLAELGPLGRAQELRRVKHTIEPRLKYRYVPEVDQEDNPQFDADDKLGPRNVITYDLTQRLFARYEPRNQYIYGIEETTPELSDLQNLSSSGALDRNLSFGFEDTDSSGDFQRLRTGAMREIANFKLIQSYDIYEANNKDDLSRDALSDLGIDTVIFPNDYIILHGRTDLDTEDYTLSSYTLEGQLQDKRGDQIRSRLSFNDNSYRQLETSAELALTNFVKVGYYSRYDDIKSEFIESRGGLRFLSKCKCWVFDVNFSDTANPDETKFFFKITLVGLGELDQRFFTGVNNNERQSSTTQ